MNFLEWLCENTSIDVYVKQYDNARYYCKKQAEKCRACSPENIRINKILKKIYFCNKKGILEKRPSFELNSV